MGKRNAAMELGNRHKSSVDLDDFLFKCFKQQPRNAAVAVIVVVVVAAIPFQCTPPSRGGAILPLAKKGKMSSRLDSPEQFRDQVKHDGEREE